jgi:hypothetical protein
VSSGKKTFPEQQKFPRPIKKNKATYGNVSTIDIELNI